MNCHSCAPLHQDDEIDENMPVKAITSIEFLGVHRTVQRTVVTPFKDMETTMVKHNMTYKAAIFSYSTLESTPSQIQQIHISSLTLLVAEVLGDEHVNQPGGIEQLSKPKWWLINDIFPSKMVDTDHNPDQAAETSSRWQPDSEKEEPKIN